MARSVTDSVVTLSVLDRLIDEEPRNSQEAQPTRAQTVRRLKEAVRRDLEWLLNTRRVAVPPDDGLENVHHSVYLFGLPDFTAYSLANPGDQNRLVRELHDAVALFEPRLANVRIVALENTTSSARTLRFRVEGLLLMDPAPEHVSFDTVLELTSGEYEVHNAG